MAAAVRRRLSSTGVLLKYLETFNTHQICTKPKRRLFSSCRLRYSVGKYLASSWSNRTKHADSETLSRHLSSCISQFENRIFSRGYSSNCNNTRKNTKANQADPWVQNYLSRLCTNIKQELNTEIIPLRDVSHYYFDGQGKYIRPKIVLLTAAACNIHTKNSRDINTSQQTVAMISEMIHTASLIHDDVIDGAETRRGKVSVNVTFGDKHCVLAGDYILSCASQALAKLGNPDVVKLLAEVVEDLVRGEFMQLGSKEDPDERFAHYLKKTYKKTASLIACCCKAVAVFSESSPDVQDVAYQYGKNIGMAFQLVDDVLDFISSDVEMGKPTAADLKLGLATAPVLFACEKSPDLNAMIMRRFKQPGDVEFARNAVYKSDSISRTYDLANHYSKEAIKQINKLKPSPERQALSYITKKVINRRK